MPIPLRSDFDAAQIRGLARRTKEAPQARRLVALAAIYDGGTRTQAAAIGGHAADRPGVGAKFQRPRARWSHRSADGEGGAGHPISFPARLDEIAREKGVAADRSASARRTRSRGGGLGGARAPRHPTISAPGTG
jgi:hypothetical protein